MSRPSRSSASTQGLTRGAMRESLGREKPGQQSNHSRVLLAHNAVRVARPRQKVRPMPTLRPHFTSTPGKTPPHFSTMALHEVGHGHSREVAHRYRGQGLHVSRDRLLYKVG
ncbi:hypothetical protein ACOSP7_013475 [Xanthoceras sorbifolium]